MNLENIITVLLSATVPSLITYFVTKKNCDSKINEIQITTNSQIEQLKLQQKYEIEKLESEHMHNLEKVEKEYQLSKESKSDELSTKMTEAFLTGELDLSKALDQAGQLKELQNLVAKYKNKETMSKFVNNH